MSRNIFESIIAAKFIATEQQVQDLATVVANGSYANSTYLKVLVAHTQQDANGSRKLTKGAQLAIVDGLHEKFYAAVIKGVGDESVPMNERNRRATFARTAASTLRKFISRGGDVRKLELDEVTKAKLREFGRKVPTGTRAQKVLQRAGEAVIRAATRLARKSPDDARKRLEAIREQIDAALEALDETKPRTRKARKGKAPALMVRAVGRPVLAPGLH